MAQSVLPILNLPDTGVVRISCPCHGKFDRKENHHYECARDSHIHR